MPHREAKLSLPSETFDEDYLHGNVSHLGKIPAFLQFPNGQTMSASQSCRSQQVCFLDTETSGLSGGTGTYAFLVGAARFIDDKFVLQQFFMRDPAEEPALLEGVANFLAPCEALVTFNGKAFDAPLLTTRYKLHYIPVPYKEYSHLDLLPLARRLWRDRLPSRALKYLEEHVLGFTRSS